RNVTGVQTCALPISLMTAATFRHPGLLAISVAQVDRMSGGRVEFGFGSGWFEDEHTAYGVPFPPTPRERFDRYEEQLDIITGLWRTPVGEMVRYEGKHYRLDRKSKRLNYSHVSISYAAFCLQKKK